MRRGRLGVAVTLAVGALLGRAAADADALVPEGARWWRSSDNPANPVACATCHHDPAETRGWAASFPKFKPLPPPHARVMTLLQANAEAVERHYGHADPRPAATAITAYLAAQAAGFPRTPGVAAGQPVFPARLRALAKSVARGRGLYARHCAACHTPPAIAPALATFPRTRGGRAESLEGFLEHHARPGEALAWDGPAMADLAAYLTAEPADRRPFPTAHKESP